jgi:hypothetical protein
MIDIHQGLPYSRGKLGSMALDVCGPQSPMEQSPPAGSLLRRRIRGRILHVIHARDLEIEMV